VLEDRGEAVHIVLVLKEQVAALALYIDDIGCCRLAELKDGKRSGHPGVSAYIVGDDLECDVGKFCPRLGQVVKLRGHNTLATDRPVQRAFVDDRPQPQRCHPSEYGLAADARLDKALNLFLGRCRQATLQGCPGVVLGLQKAWNEQRLEIQQRPGFGLKQDVGRVRLRQLAGERLEWGLPDLTDTAELLASELVTNAVLASGRLKPADRAAIPVVRLWLVSDQISMVIHVWDASSELPTRKDIGLDEEGGRGLMLVDTLGKDWGAYREAQGKVVWVMVTSAHS